MEPDVDPSAVRHVERVAQPVLSVRQTVAMENLPTAQGDSLRAVWSVVRHGHVTPAGPPFVRYHSIDAKETDVEVGVPVTSAAEGDGVAVAGTLPGGHTVETWHLGSHEQLADAYGRIEAWIHDNGWKPLDAGWEVYTWIDPTVAPDPSSWPAPTHWRTLLVQPVQRA